MDLLVLNQLNMNVGDQDLIIVSAQSTIWHYQGNRSITVIMKLFYSLTKKINGDLPFYTNDNCFNFNFN